MNRNVMAALLVLAVSGLPAIPEAHEPEPAETCTCDEARRDGGWCGVCETGYLAGVAVPSPALYEMLDPHGHDLDPSGVSCDSCLRALDTQGYCTACGIGYVAGRAYVSRLAYLVAMGAGPDSPDLRHEVLRLESALSRLEICELCAVASFVDGRCPTHDRRFRNGQPLDAGGNGKENKR